MIVLLIQIIQHKILVFDDFYEVVEANTLLIQFLDIIFDEILDVVYAFDSEIPLHFGYALLNFIEVLHAELEVVVVLLILLEIS